MLVSLGSENSDNGVYFENPGLSERLLVSGDWKSAYYQMTVRVPAVEKHSSRGCSSLPTG